MEGTYNFTNTNPTTVSESELSGSAFPGDGYDMAMTTWERDWIDIGGEG